MGEIATVLGAIAALIVILGALRVAYRRTLGRRRDSYKRLRRLAAGVRLSTLEAELGTPPTISNDLQAEVPEWDETQGEMVPVERSFQEHIFVDPRYYVQAVCDDQDKVLAFSVTTRSKRFRPTFRFPPRLSYRERRRWKQRSGEPFSYYFEVKLGRSRFTDIEPDWRPMRRAFLGARTFAYNELYYFGNPGYYQHYGFTMSSASSVGLGEPFPPIGEVAELVGRDWAGGPTDADAEELAQSEILKRFRREAVVTTYTVLAPHLRPESYPTNFGPHGDEVRTLP